MCRTAVSDYPLFEVSELELRRQGPSYTIDTVLELKAQGWTDISWLIGADMLLILPKWHRARELIQQAKILVMARPGVVIEWDALPPEFRSLRRNLVEAPLVSISATEIRRRVRAGESIDGLTPEGVVRYIREKRLYR